MSREDWKAVFKIAAIFVITAGLCIGILVLRQCAAYGLYEYTDYSGEVKEAVYCADPYRDNVYCKLEDGTKVYDIKTYRRIK